MSEAMQFWLSFYIFFMLMTGVLGFYKGQPIAAVFLGYLLGPVGLLIMLLSADKRHLACPYCTKKVHKNSYLCPHCEQKVFRKLPNASQ